MPRPHVDPDPVFAREGRDLVAELAAAHTERRDGAILSMRTPSGWVAVAVPAGARAGDVVRVPGRGLRDADGGTGDLLVRLASLELGEIGKYAARAEISAAPTRPRSR